DHVLNVEQVEVDVVVVSLRRVVLTLPPVHRQLVSATTQPVVRRVRDTGKRTVGSVPLLQESPQTGRPDFVYTQQVGVPHRLVGVQIVAGRLHQLATERIAVVPASKYPLAASAAGRLVTRRLEVFLARNDRVIRLDPERRAAAGMQRPPAGD